MTSALLHTNDVTGTNADSGGGHQRRGRADKDKTPAHFSILVSRVRSTRAVLHVQVRTLDDQRRATLDASCQHVATHRDATASVVKCLCPVLSGAELTVLDKTT